jgi:CBS-domain-containing membrane protein
MRAWQVRDVMTVEVAAVAPEASYREVVNMITGHRVGGVPVIDDAGRVLGVVSEVDVLHKLEMAETPERRRLFTGRRHAKAKADTARDLMTAPAVTATPYDPVVSAAKLMDRERVKRLPVVDDGGHLVGIVTRGDLLKVHLRPDADIRRDVVDRVLRGVLAVEEGIVRVSVDDGVVRLVGQLDRRTAVELAAHLTARVDGVVRVVNRLGYDYDDTFLAALAPESAYPMVP